MEFHPDSKVTIQCSSLAGYIVSHRVAAETYGDWAVHLAVTWARGCAAYTVTHRYSGMAFKQYIGLPEARQIAVRLDDDVVAFRAIRSAAGRRAMQQAAAIWRELFGTRRCRHGKATAA